MLDTIAKVMLGGALIVLYINRTSAKAAKIEGIKVDTARGKEKGVKRERTKGGLKWSTFITEDKQRNYLTEHWPQMIALAPDPGSDPRAKKAFAEAIKQYREDYIKKGPWQTGLWAYVTFRKSARLSIRKTPKMQQFFEGVLGRLDEMIEYEEMRKANWRWRKSPHLWGKQGPPPIASDGDTF